MAVLRVRKLGYALGGEVTGVDLTKGLDDETVAQIRQAWLEHIVLCFPGQDLEPRHLAAFAGYFGEVNNEAKPEVRHPDNPLVQVLTNKPAALNGNGSRGSRPDKVEGIFWHSDRSFMVRPAMATFVVAKHLPDVGGNTMFNNMYMAYETLSPAMQRILDPLWGVHDKKRSYPDLAQRTGHDLVMATRYGPVKHPVVRVHPETGRKALYFGAGSRTHKFVGMTEEESTPILDFLSEHVMRYEFIYRHAWRVNDLVMWDNRCAMHRVVADFDPSQLRRLIRCTVLGNQTGELYDEEAGTAAAVSATREAAAVT